METTMTLELGTLFFWLLFASALAITLALGVYWAADKWLGGGTSDQPFYWALGGAAVTIALLLLRVMPN